MRRVAQVTAAEMKDMDGMERGVEERMFEGFDACGETASDGAAALVLPRGALRWELCGEEVWLIAERALYWRARRTLLVADLHLGKAGHFRQSGLYIPSSAEGADLDALSSLVSSLEVETLIFMGDFFHSRTNAEFEAFREWYWARPQLEVLLVKGNHDILPDDQYEALAISVYPDYLKMSPFLLCHDAQALPPHLKAGHYTLSGHLHPAVRLTGPGRQSLTLPCFWFGPQEGVLPAFGGLTGSRPVAPRAGDSVFVIGGGKVVQVAD